jgi:AdoMet-dependent heme synthase
MGHMHGHAARDYSQTPVNIYWEMTQACGLACRHCRAEAMPLPHPEEMSRAESLAFIDQIPDFGQPLPQLILTGGDPLQREDLFEMIDYAVAKGIGVSITPAATELLTREMIAKLQAHGVDGLGLSLDAATAEAHDGIRGVPGTFARTMQALALAQEIGMPVQVNTLAAQETAEHIPAVYELIRPFGVKRWSLFFLISVGRGKVLQPLEAAPAEELMRWVYRTSKTAAPMILSTTEAPSYRRVAIEEMRAEGMTGEEIRRSPNARGFGIRDGHGIVFVSNTGDICPAGFLPVTTGNVRKDNLAAVYRDGSLFSVLHEPEQFTGRCGVCEYHTICGGSRARAYSATGDPLATDPLCTHEPKRTMHH